MRNGPQETVTVGELLARIRTTYVEEFARRLEQAGREGQGRLLPEAALCRPDGGLALAGALELPQRVDACAFSEGEAASVLSFGSERMLTFDPLTLVWGDHLDVELHPFTWDDCELRFAPPSDGDLGALTRWFRHWFDEADERAQTNEFPGNVVHSFSGPSDEDGIWAVAIDLGSARIKAFEELLDAVAGLDRRHVTVGRPGATDA